MFLCISRLTRKGEVILGDLFGFSKSSQKIEKFRNQTTVRTPPTLFFLLKMQFNYHNYQNDNTLSL